MICPICKYQARRLLVRPWNPKVSPDMFSGIVYRCIVCSIEGLAKTDDNAAKASFLAMALDERKKWREG